MSGELHVQHLGKSYRQWGSELRRVASWFAPFIRPREEHWVLKRETLIRMFVRLMPLIICEGWRLIA